MKLSRKKLRGLINEILSEGRALDVRGETIKITDSGNIVIRNEQYSLSAKITGPDPDVRIKDIYFNKDNELVIKADALLYDRVIKTVEEVLTKDKVAEIAKNVESGKDKFEIPPSPSKPDGNTIIFNKVA